MGKRGPKPQFTDVACPNHSCKSYGLTGEGNIVGNGTSVSRGEKVRKYICRHCGKVFNDHTGTFYYDLRKEESVIDLALKMSYPLLIKWKSLHFQFNALLSLIS